MCAIMPAVLVMTPMMSVRNIVIDQLFVCRVGRKGRSHEIYPRYNVVGMVMSLQSNQDHSVRSRKRSQIG